MVKIRLLPIRIPHHIIKALESLEFFVIQELFMTETAEYADVILPGVSYAEKEGTFTNTERRVQRVRKAVTIPGNARLDTDIIIDLMNRMGYPQPHLTSAQIMDEISSVTPSFGGISHARLDSEEVGGKAFSGHVRQRIIREHRSCMSVNSREVLDGSILQNTFLQQSFRMRNIRSS